MKQSLVNRPALFFISLIIFLGLLYLFPIFINYVNYECFWKKYFNITCAGCGFTRMIEALFHFDFYQAFRYNPLLFVLVILFTLYLIYVLICALLKKKYFKSGYKSLVMMIILIMVYMLLRNVPFFEWLKPVVLSGF